MTATLWRRTLGLALVGLLVAGWRLTWGQGPLTNAMNVNARSDSNGYLMIITNVAGAQGPLTALGNLRLRSDSNGYLMATLSGTNTVTSLLATATQLTAGSGTGLTVNNAGELRQAVYKITAASTAFVCAATTCDVTLATLPAKTFVSHALADIVTTFACASVCTSSTLSIIVGKTAGGNQYLVSFDADAAAAQFGDTAAELGASLTEATIPTTIGDLASWSATTAVTLRLTSGTGNIGNGTVTNLSQGSVTVYLTALILP